MPSEQYAYRQNRSAQDAVRRVHWLLTGGHRNVVDADLAGYYDTITYAETLYDVPLRLHYSGLDPARHYRLRVTYAGEDYALPLRLTAYRSLKIHPMLQRKSNPQTLEFDLPAEATLSGELDLEWAGPENSGGSGRGRQVAEVWLFPVQTN